MDIAPLARWIAERATATDDRDGLLAGLGEALAALGLPLWRLSVATPAIDPTTRAFSANWRADTGLSLVRDGHGADIEARFQKSPIYALIRDDLTSCRHRLDSARPHPHFPLLRDLAAEGATDYVMHLVAFAPGTALRGAALSFATRAPGGFSDGDLAAIETLLPVLGLAMAKLSLAETLRETLGTYLGRTTGDRVLHGEIRRGQGQTVPAALLLTDLRAFTALTDRADPLDVVRWLDEHFDALGEAVHRHGGEILKFLGDGFLAAFPIRDAAAMPCAVCESALDAAAAALADNAALNARRREAGLPELAADCVLHFGAVVYGNVGTGRRLDFTVIGRAVNEASRIEGQCEALGRSLLISDSFARRCGRPLENLGSVELRGLARAQRVWTLPGS